MIVNHMAIFKKIMSYMEVRLRHIVVLTGLSLGIAVLGAAATGLLIPLARGIVLDDFKFVQSMPVLNQMTRSLAEWQNVYWSSYFLISITLIVFVCFIEIVKTLLQYVLTLLAVQWGERYSARVKEVLFARYLAFGKSFFDKSPQGVLAFNVWFAEHASRLFDEFRKFCEYASLLALHIVILFIISWKLSCFLVVLFIVLYVCMRKLFRKIFIIANKTLAIDLEFNQKLFTMLDLVSLIKKYSQEEASKQIYSKMIRDRAESIWRINVIGDLIEPIQKIVLLILLVCGLCGAILFLEEPGKKVALSMFILFFYVCLKSLPMVRTVVSSIVTYLRIMPGLKQILEVIEGSNDCIIVEGSEIFAGLKKEITFNQLTFSYNAAPVLHEVSFSIAKGGVTAIVGETGSGKTTLAHLLMRFYDCPSGSILIDGVDIRHYSLKSIRAQMVLVEQKPQMFYGSLRENIAYGMELRVPDERLYNILEKVRLDRFIAELPHGLDTMIGEHGNTLSAGETQRIAIARALLRDPEIIIFDEVTNLLDICTERFIREATEEAVKNRTAIIITHRLQTIKNADKIIVLSAGKVIEEGAFQYLLQQKGMLYRYWQEFKCDIV